MNKLTQLAQQINTPRPDYKRRIPQRMTLVFDVATDAHLVDLRDIHSYEIFVNNRRIHLNNVRIIKA